MVKAMQRIVSDLHLHSKYSRAVSPHMNLEEMAKQAEIKGIDLLTTADFTYPQWYEEICQKLEEVGKGIYKIKNSESRVRYLIGTEISMIYSQGGKGRRVHMLVLAPNLEIAGKINKKLTDKGCNLKSDGRPIIGLSVIETCKILFSISEEIVVIPAHVWTPWFGMLGSKSGFDSLRECYGDYAEKIKAVETGLSSDPDMNWQIEEFDNLSVVSFSDAHSPAKLGRELTIFSGEGEFNFDSFRMVLAKEGKWKIEETIEFYPDEGKYHVDGHRKCNVWQLPEKTAKMGRMCPVCGKSLTLGVTGRVEDLARKDKLKIDTEIDKWGVKWHKSERRPKYAKLVPLQEILSEALEKGVNTKTVINKYKEMIEEFGTELEILTKVEIKKLKEWDEWIGEAIERVRKGDIYVRPGYDGVFGKVSIWEDEMESEEDKKEQLGLF